jgi:hypothetical protein
VTWFVRCFDVTFAALNHDGGGQPFCKLRGPAFGIVYIIMGVISCVLGVFGAYKSIATWGKQQGWVPGNPEGVSMSRFRYA